MNARRITLLLCTAETLGMAGFALFAALLPQFQALWGLSNTEAGWIGGGFFLGYMLAVPVLTGLTDRHDARLIYLWAMLLTAVASAGFVFADGFWSALLWRVLAGIGLAGTYMPGLKALSERIDGASQSRAIAFYTASFGLGTALSFTLSGELARLGGWQLPALLSGACALLAWALVYWGMAPKAVVAHAPRNLLDLAPLKNRAVLAYCLAYAMHNLELFALRAWLVAFVVFSGHLQGVDPWLSGTWVAMLATLIGMPSSILGNELALRFGRQRWLIGVMLSSALLAAVVGLGAALPFWAMLGLILIYAVTVTADSASLTAGLVSVAPASHRGAAMALYSCTGFTGAFLGPLLFGMTLDVLGDELLLGWWAAFALMGLLLTLGPLALWWAGWAREVARAPE
ncbi:Predicted arabinose efflux permease, MFS family [Ectopseudomonas composti]|uniref:Predicted arabinose efflux permease, MFS family n=1 Tax=Ectopseudomonas composti TaxID=658457 RepID=A0A1I5RD54_9GAMM|nr:MFS transporter [Pseudomonas composti]SFP56442.1 Predicted arabinose efflux permease, MFS family [Pseudomonas composti]